MNTIQKNTNKQHVALLVKLCAAYGLRKIVISPGSRNGPLIIAFHNQPEIECYVIPDERSAAYFALGIAQHEQQPVGIVCTSGTAALNFAPALAEAWYQKIPLLAITADRPPEWVDQNDGQTINQTGIFHNFVTFEATLPSELTSENERWHIERIMRDTFLNLTCQKLPVHINIPIREPLYNLEDDNIDIPAVTDFKIFQPHITTNTETFGNFYVELDTARENILQDLQKYERVLLITGMQFPNTLPIELIKKNISEKHLVVLTEILSNIKGNIIFQTHDAFLQAVQNSNKESLQPDLIISFGDMLLSKPLKQWIRSLQNASHWVITKSKVVPDVFQKIDRIIPLLPQEFLNIYIHKKEKNNTQFYNAWNDLFHLYKSIQLKYLETIEWSDLKVFFKISKTVPSNSYLHLGNSSPVRYSSFFEWADNIQFFSNRGTAGIDGCSSTAAGFATQTKKIVTLITGDISFLYDSNALWNKYKSSNLRIIVINNCGGNIFSLIPGPEKTGLLNNYFYTHVPVSINHLCKAYGIEYMEASNEQELKVSLEQFYSAQCFSILEIHTNPEINTGVWKKYFKTFRNDESLGNH